MRSNELKLNGKIEFERNEKTGMLEAYMNFGNGKKRRIGEIVTMGDEVNGTERSGEHS